MTDFTVRELPSRRLRSVTPIPWAQPAPATAQGYPSWQAKEPFYSVGTNRRLQSVALNEYPATASTVEIVATLQIGLFFNAGTKRRLQKTRLDSYPATPAGFFDGFYPGSKAVESNKVGQDRARQLIPELNSYPATPAIVPHSSIVGSGFHFNAGLKRKLQSVELNTYPATPTGYYSGYYPGSKAVQSYKVSFDRKIQSVELNEYPSPPTSPATLPALVKPGIFFRPSRRVIQDLPQLDQYTAPDPSVTFGLTSTITDTIGLTGTITSTHGEHSLIANTFGIDSEIK